MGQQGVKKWNVIKEGNLTFEFPNRFSEISLGEKPEEANALDLELYILKTGITKLHSSFQPPKIFQKSS